MNSRSLSVYLRFLTLLCLWAAVLTGCTRETVIVDGVEREFVVYRTPDPTSAPWPVVFFFHGARERSFYANKLFEEASLRNILLVGMQGVRDEAFYYFNHAGVHEAVTGWALHGTADHENNPDLRYFDAVLELLNDKYPLDKNRIHLAGFSMGSFFIHTMAGYRSMIIASVATASGGINPGGIADHCEEDDRGYCFVDPVVRSWEWLSRMERKFPVFLFHGEFDTLVPPDRSLQARDAYMRAGWTGADTGNLPGKGATCAPEVHLRLVPGLGHDWPRGWNNTAGYDATPEVFDFFDSHPRLP